MGGFTINGFGAADSFYPVKSLGFHKCPSCGTNQEFAVMEVRRKIKMLYISTVTVNTKYAVACKSCKNGVYISDDKRVELLSERAKLRVELGSFYFDKCNESSIPQVQNVVVQAAPVSQPAPAVTATGSGVVCPSCGAKQPNGGMFCFACGKKIEKPVVEEKVAMYCPACGKKQLAVGAFCSHCGQKLL